MAARSSDRPGADGAPPALPVREGPQHVAIIMDGNGRWARARGRSRHAGHRAGTENIRAVLRHFGERGVPYLTLYAFSTENWGRPRAEVRALMRLLADVLRREVQQLHAEGVRLLHLGRLEEVAEEVRRQILDAIDLTKDNTRLTVAVAFNYGGRQEIADAVRRIVSEGVPAEAVDEALIARYLTTAGLPDPDLMIRTGGEFRISNFLLWQSAYAEFYSTPTLWPDFGAAEIDAALASYAARRRRFGALPDQGRRPARRSA